MTGSASRLTTLAVSAAVLAAVVVPMARPASAHTATYACRQNHVCLWEGLNFTGRSYPVSGFSNYTDLPAWIHDNAESWGSSTQSRNMCIFDWKGSERRTLAVLEPGSRAAFPSYFVRNRADAIGFC